MKESQAWRVLAKEHDEGRSGSQYLCQALKHADTSGNLNMESIPNDLRITMLARIVEWLDPDMGGAYDNDEPDMTYDEQRQGRVLACLIFAAEAAEEERGL